MPACQFGKLQAKRINSTGRGFVVSGLQLPILLIMTAWLTTFQIAWLFKIGRAVILEEKFYQGGLRPIRSGYVISSTKARFSYEV